jgi:hypothetical protein
MADDDGHKDDGGTDEGTQDRDERDDDLEEQDDTGGEDGGEDEGEYTPPTREEWAKVQRALTRRRDERNKAREEARKLRDAAAAQGKAKEDTGGQDGKSDDADAKREEQESRWRITAARSSAAVQLTAAGFSGTAKQAKRLTALLDLTDAEPDAEGDFDFEEQIDDLKEEYPQLFRSRDQEETARRPAARPTTADKGRRTDRDATVNPTQRTSAALRRMAGLRPQP